MNGILTAGAYAGALVALAGAVGLGVSLFKKAVRETVSSRLDSLERKLHEADEDLAAHHALILGKLNRLEETVTEVKGQVFPNSGSSLRDRVDELYELVLSS